MMSTTEVADIIQTVGNSLGSSMDLTLRGLTVRCSMPLRVVAQRLSVEIAMQAIWNFSTAYRSQ